MSRKSFGAKPLCYPQPVFIIATYNEDGTPNAMNAAWGGISDEKEISLCIGLNHKTTENLLNCGAFTVSCADEAHIAGCDYVGIVSGKTEKDKFQKAGFTAIPSEKVNAPIINELPVCLECKILDYNQDTCILRGEIIDVSVDEAYLTDGKADVHKIRPVIVDAFNGTYNVIGDVVGTAWGSGLILK